MVIFGFDLFCFVSTRFHANSPSASVYFVIVPYIIVDVSETTNNVFRFQLQF